VVERGDVMRAKPEPDLFLACQERMRVAVADCTVVGDAVWTCWPPDGRGCCRSAC